MRSATGVVSPVCNGVCADRRQHQVQDQEHRKILTRYASWHVLRQLRAAADHGRSGTTGTKPPTTVCARSPPGCATSTATVAPWPPAVRSNSTDGSPTRTPTHQRGAVRGGLAWAARTHTLARLRLPQTTERGPARSAAKQQVQLVRRSHTRWRGHGPDRTRHRPALLAVRPTPSTDRASPSPRSGPARG